MSANESDDRPIGEYFLLVLLQSTEPQAPGDLLLAAWRSHPRVFGLAGCPTRLPDARHLDTLRKIREEWLCHEDGRYATAVNIMGCVDL